MTDWNLRFLALADHVAQWSKDPSTKVGAVIVRPNLTVCSMGYNGLPRKIKDDERLNDRAVKYEIVVHAEDNALLMTREDLSGYYIYTTLPPCSRCAARIIQSGIVAVYSYEPPEHWRENCRLADELLREARMHPIWYTREGQFAKDYFELQSPTNK